MRCVCEEQVAVADRTPEQRAISGQVDSPSSGTRSTAPSRLRTMARKKRPANRFDSHCRHGRQLLATRSRACWCRTMKARSRPRSSISQIYDRVQRQVYLFLTATLIAIVLTSLYLIRSNRRAVCPTGDAFRAAQRSGAETDFHSGIHAALHLSRTARRVRPDSDCYRFHAGRSGQAPPEGSPLRADIYRKSARLLRTRWTRCAAFRRRCIR